MLWNRPGSNPKPAEILRRGWRILDAPSQALGGHSGIEQGQDIWRWKRFSLPCSAGLSCGSMLRPVPLDWSCTNDRPVPSLM